MSEDAKTTMAGEQPVLDPGPAGRSINRAHQARKAQREKHVRAKHPVIGGVLLALQREPQHEEAFRRGAAGERKVAATLTKHLSPGTAVLLHNRRIPGKRGDIDHLAVSATGVWVIDTKAARGQVRIRRPLLRAARLMINGRNRSNLIDGLDRQVTAVHEALADHPDVRVRGVLCFTDASLPHLRRQIRGHMLLHPRGLARSLKTHGPIPAERRQTLTRLLAAALPAA